MFYRLLYGIFDKTSDIFDQAVNENFLPPFFINLDILHFFW